MKAIIINNEIKFDEDALSLADMGYDTGEEIEVEFCEFSSNDCSYYSMYAKKDVVIDGVVGVYKGEGFNVSNEEIEVLA